MAASTFCDKQQLHAVDSTWILKRTTHQLVNKFNFSTKQLDEQLLRQLKTLIKRNGELVEPFLEIVFKELHRDDSDRRLGALLLIDQIFIRSHRFREALIEDFQDLLLYTAETDPLRNPLPGPPEAAKVLKLETIKIVSKWHGTYGPAYTKLALAFEYLKTCKSLDFERLDAETLVERERSRAAADRKERLAKRIAENIEQKFADCSADINRCVTETKNAVELLCPQFCSQRSDIAVSQCLSQLIVQLHGIADVDHEITVTVRLSTAGVAATNDNAVVLHALADCYKLLTVHQHRLNKWLAFATKAGSQHCQPLIKRMIDAKAAVSEQLAKCTELNVTASCAAAVPDNNDASDSDFEDVPEKEGLELDHPCSSADNDSIPSHVLNRLSQLEDIETPGPSGLSSLQCSRNSEQQPALTSQDIAAVPQLDFGLDLMYWGAEKVEPASIVKNDMDCHRFWRSPDEGDTIEGKDEMYKSRVINFTGRFLPVERECRHPLSNGKLCVRRDRLKCPFHGIIIDRNANGQPTTTTAADSSSKSSDDTAVREEVAFVKDVESATGANLSSAMTRKSRTVVKRKPSASQLARNRLTSKLFDRKALKRVGETLDAVQQAKAEKKFAQQFNLAMSKSKK